MEESSGLTTMDEYSAEGELNTEEDREANAWRRELQCKLDVKQIASYAKALTKDSEQSKSISQEANGRQIPVNMEEVVKIPEKVEIKQNVAVVPEDKESKEED